MHSQYPYRRIHTYTEPEPVSEDTDSGNTDIGESQEDFYEDDDDGWTPPPNEDEIIAKRVENNKDDIQPEDYDKIDWSHTIH